MDVHEDNEKNIVTATFELPGLTKENVNLDVHNNVLTVSGEAELAPAIAPLLGAGDMVICLGAGDITKWAANLAGALKTAGAA